MELWTEYEGRTIDGVFPLNRLLRPEGRSAFFLTSNGTGIPRLIRLIEPHFDEEEILARWQAVAALNHPNLVKLEKFGQATLDGGALLYAVVEPVDANLGEVLTGQTLTLEDTRQLATSLISALEALHSHGFVHEHIEPAHIFAIGETVKLRSDCVREVSEDERGSELKKRDVHDVAVVLLQALTRQTNLQAASRDLPLPAPFDQIVRNGISGKWGTTEIANALEPAVSKNQPAEASPSAVSTSPPPEPPKFKPTPTVDRIPVDRDERTHSTRPTAIWAAVAGAALLIFLLGWHFLSGRRSSQSTAPPTPAASTVTSAPPPPAGAAATPNPQPIDVRNQWRVIAYTYNRQDQAQHKADTVARLHPDLDAEVFTPTGRAPYLVAIGGVMSRDQAFVLVQKVRNEGLPRDAYAQNYSTKAR
jgi:eukaryotic-like serine/threonine-protein kinase